VSLVDASLRLVTAELSTVVGLVDPVTADELRDVLRRLQAIRSELAPQAGDGVHLTFDDDERAAYRSRPLSLRSTTSPRTERNPP
jgi:hypothetical protein